MRESSSSKRTSAKFFSSFQETHHLFLTHQAPRKYIERHSRVGNKPLFDPQHVQLVQNVNKIQQFSNRSSLSVCRVCRVCRVPLARPSTRPWHCPEGSCIGIISSMELNESLNTEAPQWFRIRVPWWSMVAATWGGPRYLWTTLNSTAVVVFLSQLLKSAVKVSKHLRAVLYVEVP